MEPGRIVLCVSDPQWTLEALHLAGAVASDFGYRVALVQLVSVDHPLLLGTEEAYSRYTTADQEKLREYAAALEAYGVLFDSYVYPYVSMASAIVDIAEQLEACIVFATLPHGLFQFWRRFRLWTIRHRLRQRDCPLYTLDTPLETLVWTPASASRLRHPSHRSEEFVQK